MPAEAYTTEQSAKGRVACVMSFRVARDERRVVFLPRPYLAELEFMMSGLGSVDNQVSQMTEAVKATKDEKR